MKRIILFIFAITVCNLMSAQRVGENRIENKQEHKRFNKNTDIYVVQSPLMDKYDVKFYKLDIDVERNNVDVAGNVLMNAKVVAAVLDTFVFELNSALNIDSIKINNQKRTYYRVGWQTFVPTAALNNGANLNAIKELLGHANLSATQIYTHNTIEKLTNIYKQAHPRA